MSPRWCLPNPGHSLGGALATLAALDVRRGCPGLGRLDLSCYTFGAPRTGDHAFACDYNGAVPDSWAIINDQVGRGLLMIAREILSLHCVRGGCPLPHSR